MTKLKPLAPARADAPAPVDYPVALAVRALKEGTASEHQQKIALEWIVAGAAGKRYFPYHATDRDTAFALGRYFVAEQIVGLFHVDLSTLRKQHDHEETPTEKS